MRTEQLKYGCKEMVEQIIWLMAQFYDNDRVMMITGRKGNRPVKVNAKKMFGRELKGAVQPPPYTVQIEISSSPRPTTVRPITAPERNATLRPASRL